MRILDSVNKERQRKSSTRPGAGRGRRRSSFLMAKQNTCNLFACALFCA
jgi:hypothetical protein